MSWAVNRGPSFRVSRDGNTYNQLTGFTQRFMLPQDSNMLTPGKAEPHLPSESVKGSTKSGRKRKSGLRKKPERCKNLIMPKDSLTNTPIYSGFGTSLQNKAKKKVVKPKTRKRRVK